MVNPKKAFGMAKPPLHLIPPSAMIHAAMSFKDGAQKYGPYNWRTTKVDATTYAAAAKRHLELWFHGQELTSDSKVHNLGAVIACCAILLDAQDFGFLEDDRPPAVDLEAVMKQWTAAMVKEPSLDEALAETNERAKVVYPPFKIDLDKGTVEMFNVKVDSFRIVTATEVALLKLYSALVTKSEKSGQPVSLTAWLRDHLKDYGLKGETSYLFLRWQSLRGGDWLNNLGAPQHKEHFIELALEHLTLA